MSEKENEAKAIEFLYEYAITKKEFETLEPDLAAAVSVACYAYSEVNALMRLYLFSVHDHADNDVIDSMGAIQSNVLLRAWSAKLFEFADFVELKKHNKTKSNILITLANAARKEFEPLKKDSAYQTVRALRNEATSHYSLEPAKKNLAFLGQRAALSIVQHKMGGNSFNPLGEEVMFIGRMNRAAKHLQTKEDKVLFHKQWFDWNLKATKWLGKVQAQFAKKIIFEKFPDRRARRLMHYIPQQMVGEVGESKTPLFCRASEYNRAKEEK